MRSSYIQNNYGDVFYRMITTYRPRKCVELGVLDGYSTLHNREIIFRRIQGQITFSIGRRYSRSFGWDGNEKV